MEGVLSFLKAMGILICVGVCVALIYFLTIIGGVAIGLFILYVLVREYHAEKTEDDPFR